jgi:hypothetical protein
LRGDDQKCHPRDRGQHSEPDSGVHFVVFAAKAVAG